MLNNIQIQEINRAMLGLGAPIEKDGQGYNKPDFSMMENIGMLATPLSFIESYAVLDTLQKYRNTQLSGYSDDLENTYDDIKQKGIAEYGSEARLNQAARDAVYGVGHGSDDYCKRRLRYYGMSGEYFIAGFQEYVDGTDLRPFGGRWTRLTNGQSAMMIPAVNLSQFLDYVASRGKYGYEATEALISAVKQYLTEASNTVETQDDIRLTPLGKKNQYGHDLYEINKNTYAFALKLWSIKGTGLKYVDTKSNRDKIIVSTTPDMLKVMLDFLSNDGVDTSAVTGSKTIKVVDTNASGNTLIDVTKLDMPFELYPFQIEDANIMVARKKALLGSDMGVGKSIISAIVGLSIPGKKLIICPETLRLNWNREIHFADKNADVTIIYAKDKNPQFGEWVVMGYKTAVKFADVIKEAGFTSMFVDEAHKCKAVSNFGSPASQQAKAVMSFAKVIPHVYLLTGTPMPTRNKDLFNELVMLGEIDASKKYAFHKFGTKFCDGKKTGYGWDYTGSSNTDELHRILKKYMIRRLKSEVLPNLKKQRIPLLIESKLSKDYKDIEKRLRNTEEGDTYMGLAMSGRRFLSKCKIDSAIEFADDIVETGESVVIVAEFDETLDALMEHYGESACCIRGGMSDTAKQTAIDQFQSGQKKVCCINLIAAGVGITLTKAHNMVIIDYDWTPSNMTQVEDRICRTGQTQPCNIYYICHNDAILDQIFIEMITAKSENIDRVVDNSENTVDLVKMKDSADFFTRLKARVNQ